MPKAAKILDGEFTRYEHMLQRMMVLGDAAAGQLLPYVRLTMPVPEAPDDVTRTQYDDQKFHRVMAAALEEVCFGRIRRLVISMPPRHGKTEAAAKKFIPFYAGHNPGKSVIFGTYNDKFSQDIGRAVRDNILHPATRQAFPDLQLKVDSAASDRLETTKGAVLAFVGRGGTTTGRGADCFPPGTMIATRQGEVAIELFATTSAPEYVLAYDRERGQIVEARVEAIQVRKGRRLRRIGLASGRVVTATGDHRFLANGEWVQADRLAPGDRLVRAVRRGDDQIRPRDEQACSPGPHGVFLRQRVLGAQTERKGVSRAGLPELRRATTSGEHHLLPNLSLGRKGEEEVGDQGAQYPLLPGVPQRIYDRAGGPDEDTILFEGVRRPRARPEHVQDRQPEVARRRDRSPEAISRREGVSHHAPADPGAGRVCLRGVPSHIEAGGSPPRREPDEQRGPEPDSSLLGLPPGGACGGAWGAGDDIVVSVEDIYGETDLYDLQVGCQHNFIAEGVVVHNCFIIDDPFKDSAEADSPTIRENAWTWFNRVAGTRLMTDQGAIIIIGTRWHPDDIIGRLTDPSNDHYDPEEAETWRIIDFPALAREDDLLGRKEGEALWPSRFGAPFLKSLERRDPRGFSALYQGRPNPEGGTFFEEKWLKTYLPNELPKQLRIYAASDHAVSMARGSDKTCLMCVGVSEDDHIWVLPDLIWRIMNAEQAVDNMLTLMRRYHPLLWWAERSHISKSIGPFLRKRMMEEQVYCSIVETPPIGDKQTRAQSIQGRMSMGMVHWPSKAVWWPAARDELLRFPHDAHDDLVDTVSYIGMGLTSLVGAPSFRPRNELRPGTFGWLKEQRRQSERAARSNTQGGW